EVEGRAVLVGSHRLLRESGIALGDAGTRLDALEADGKTALLVVADGRLVGLIAVADTVKDGAADAVRALRALDLDVALLTGDNCRTAEAIGRLAGIDRAIAEVRPEEKTAGEQRLQAEGK